MQFPEIVPSMLPYARHLRRPGLVERVKALVARVLG